MKKAFTIVELLMVIGIIGVLTGIVTTAASSAVKNSRSRKMEALCTMVEAGLNTYHAQEGRWPKDPPEPGTNPDPDDPNNPDRVMLPPSDVKDWVLALVQKSKDGTPVMDVSGLFVSGQDQGGDDKKVYGMDFMTAIRGSRKNSKRMKISQMYFGYQDPSTGRFKRFKILYSHASDSVTVTHQ